MMVSNSKEVPLRPTCCRRCTRSRRSADCLSCCRTDDGTDDLSGAGVMLGNLVDLLDHGFVQSRTYGARGKACARDAAHDAADRYVDKDLSAAAVVFHVMGESVCLFAEDGGEFLLFFYFLLVKDSPKLVQCIARVSAKI